MRNNVQHVRWALLEKAHKLAPVCEFGRDGKSWGYPISAAEGRLYVTKKSSTTRDEQLVPDTLEVRLWNGYNR